jgi:EmrB/QacA subfamily drug resistance transporter
VALITESNRQWWTLVASCAGLFLLMLDSTIVTLALPSIQRDLDASHEALQWVMNGYLLIIAVLVVTLGRLGDMFGRKRLFLIGMAVFAAGSVVSAAAPDDVVLVGGRFVQGAGGAAMLVLSLAVVSDAFSDRDRPRALGIWAAVSAVALAIGPLLGGVLIDEVSWRAIFWINLPIAAFGAWLLQRAARESRDETAGHRVDVPGLITLSIGLGALVLALVQSEEWGFDSARTLAVMAAGILSLAAFWLVEHRVAQPIVEFPLFRNGPYFGASAAAFSLVGAYWTVIFFQPQYLQNVLDYSVLASGFLVLPITAPMAVVSPFSGPLIERFGARVLMTVGMICAVAGLVVQARVSGSSDYLSLLPGFVLFGIALGLVYAPMSTAAMMAMPRAKAGIAAGVLAMNRVFAGALGLAVVGAVFLHLQSDELSDLLAKRAAGLGPGRAGELDGLLAGSESARRELEGLSPGVAARVEEIVRDTFTFALGNALWVLVGLTAVGAVLTWAFIRSQSAGAKPPAAATAPGPVPSHPLLHRSRFHY